MNAVTDTVRQSKVLVSDSSIIVGKPITSDTSSKKMKGLDKGTEEK